MYLTSLFMCLWIVLFDGWRVIEWRMTQRKASCSGMQEKAFYSPNWSQCLLSRPCPYPPPAFFFPFSKTCSIWRFPGGRIGAAAASHSHSYSHSNSGSKPPLWPTPQLTAKLGSLTQWVKPGIEPVSSWILVGFIKHWTMMGTPYFSSY